MKRGSMRFWLCASGAGLIVSSGLAQLPTKRYRIDDKYSPRPFRSNELTLGGLRPGIATKARATALNRIHGSPRSEDGSTVWFDEIVCEKMNVEFDAKGVIETVRLSANVFNGQKGCDSVAAGTRWRTGKGLFLKSACGDATRLYGEPTSRSPSTKNGQPLELLYYAFDWAGPDVPQVMEVVCTAPKDGSPGRVVEITLAASSL